MDKLLSDSAKTEYIVVYVDDLCIAAQDPKEIINILQSTYELKVE